MKKLLLTLFVPTLLLVGVLTAASQPVTQSTSTAEYHVVYESTWSSETHPIDYPTNSAHYSRLVGATHSDVVHFWRTGELASEGIERMAELGSNGTLNDEVDVAIAAGAADRYINGPSLGSGTGTMTINSLVVDSNYPLLTLVSMIAPSPDWFVGIDSVSLLDTNGNWIDEMTITMYPYDAGTDNGTTYSSGNADANPPQNIRNYQGVFPFSNEPMGTLTITRLETPTPTQTATATATAIVTATPTVTATPIATASPTATATAFPCPMATPEGFMVDYTSPTHLLTQTLGVRIGNGDMITVTAPTGVYTRTGSFAYNTPELIAIDLMPNSENPVHVEAHVRAQTGPGGCPYGDYTLSRSFTIVQDGSPLDEQRFLPVVRQD